MNESVFSSPHRLSGGSVPVCDVCDVVRMWSMSAEGCSLRSKVVGR